MKRKIRVILFFVFLYFMLVCNAQEWVKISPLPESYQWIKGNFISAEEGWAYCNNSISKSSIYHTIDGGNSWTKIYVVEDSTETFTALKMIDAIVGWGVESYNGNYRYLKTPDGGRSWIEMNSFLPDVSVRSLYFLNKDFGLIAADYDFIDSSTVIYKTVNGGWNWHKVITPTIFDPYPMSYYVNNFFFLDEDHGWAACTIPWDAGTILYTTDGGETWERNTKVGMPDAYQIQFVDQNNGCAVGNNAFYTFVYITDNNFETVKHQYTNSTWNQLAKTVCYQNDSIIWVSGNPGYINRSTDGGATFEEFQFIDTNFFYIQFFNTTGFLYGYDGIYKFVDDSSIEQDQLATISDYVLMQNYPNPFNPVTQIKFDLAKASEVKLSVYNISGQKVAELVNGTKQAGRHTVDFDCSKLNSGVYYYTLVADGKSMTQKMVLTK